MQTKTAIAILILLSFVIVAIVYAILSAHVKIGNYATIKTVGVSVYSDPALTQPVIDIKWGRLEPNSTTEELVYIQNTGNTPAILTLTIDNWNPPLAETYISLTWNYTGTLLNPNEAIPITFTLIVSPDVTGFTNFTFDITITATA